MESSRAGQARSHESAHIGQGERFVKNEDDIESRTIAWDGQPAHETLTSSRTRPRPARALTHLLRSPHPRRRP
jgi:hypothetical protein